jgi:hypothetical protein
VMGSAPPPCLSVRLCVCAGDGGKPKVAGLVQGSLPPAPEPPLHRHERLLWPPGKGERARSHAWLHCRAACMVLPRPARAADVGACQWLLAHTVHCTHTLRS